MSTSTTALIDGLPVLPDGNLTILEAAEQAGVSVPTLCHGVGASERGACRICVVEVEGQHELAAACHTRLQPGQVIHTRSPRVIGARRTLLELAIAGVKASGSRLSDTRLGKLAAEYGADPDRFSGAQKLRTIVKGDPLLVQDLALCIRCDRCWRYCDVNQGIGAIAPVGRGVQSHIATFFHDPLSATKCQHCGGCAEVCPTGAIAELWRHEFGKSERRGPTLCPYCGTGCQIFARVADGLIIGVEPAGGESFNKTDLCVKGRMAFDFLNHPDRLTAPLIKDPESSSRFPGFREAAWDEALELIKSRLTAIKDQYGPSAVMGISSSRGTNEENYLFQKFMRLVVGTNNVDNCARVCHSPSVAGLVATFGGGAATNSLDEIQETEVLLLVGCNPTEAHPVIGMRIKRAIFEKGVRTIVADPRKIELARLADYWLPLRPGTNVALLNGLAHVILRDKLHNVDFIAERTEQFELFAEKAREYPPQRVEAITGVPASTLEAAARLYGRAKRAMILYGLGVTEHTDGSLGVMGCANLALLTGNVGRRGTGVNPLRGQNNVQGSCDMGALPNVLPGYQPLDDEAVRAKFEKAWGRNLPVDRGLKFTEAWPLARRGRVRAAYILGHNPAQTDPHSQRVVEALKAMDFVVVHEIFLTKTAALADVVLPAATFAEKEGTFINADRRVQRVRKIVEPPQGCKTDVEILCELSDKMGYAMPARTPSEIMDEIASLVPVMHGISHRRLDQQPLVWPCLDETDSGAQRLYEASFPRGRAAFQSIDHCEPMEGKDEAYPIILTTGRRLEHYNCGSMSRRSPGLRTLMDEEHLEINPQDAAELNVREHDLVEVASRRGRLTVHAHLTDRVSLGVVFLSFHFDEVPTNELTGDYLDTLACTPEYKVTAVRVKPA
ncbi:MAG: formate dehydrogenase subunit alpha [Thermoguttaceae bacterium]|jgi:formate dehydrogenase alpha subunit